MTRKVYEQFKDFEILAPQSDDSMAIASLHAQSWQENYRGVFSDRFLNHVLIDDRLKIWTKRVNAPSSNQYILLAKQGNVLAGFLCAYMNDHPVYGPLLDNLHVATQYKGLGLGRHLMTMLARKIDNGENYNGMYLWVLEQNQEAIQFYERLGGSLVETVEGNDIGDRPFLKRRYHWKQLDALSGNQIKT